MLLNHCAIGDEDGLAEEFLLWGGVGFAEGCGVLLEGGVVAGGAPEGEWEQ